MRKFFISLVLTVGLVAVTGSCTKTATNEHAQEAQTEQVEAKTTVEHTTVTTSKGTYNIKMVMKRMYKEGVSFGKTKKAQYDKSPDKYPKEKALEDGETVFKDQWRIYYGNAESDDAKAVYEMAREQFFKGCEGAWNL